MITLPSGSFTKPMWQTPVSSIPITSPPAVRKSSTASWTSGTRKAIPFVFGMNSSPCSSGFQNEQREVADLDLALLERALAQLEDVAVERDGALNVTRRDGHEVDLFDLHD